MSTPLVNTQEYFNQTGATVNFTNQTATTTNYTEQEASNLTYTSLVRIDGTLYGDGDYGAEFYSGEQYILGKR